MSEFFSLIGVGGVAAVVVTVIWVAGNMAWDVWTNSVYSREQQDEIIARLERIEEKLSPADGDGAKQ